MAHQAGRISSFPVGRRQMSFVHWGDTTTTIEGSTIEKRTTIAKKVYRAWHVKASFSPTPPIGAHERLSPIHRQIPTRVEARGTKNPCPSSEGVSSSTSPNTGLGHSGTRVGAHEHEHGYGHEQERGHDERRSVATATPLDPNREVGGG